ncbi:MAG: VWA domain-containing protein [Acidobacteria bacterium]|nr:VWA domain-containing protein [Acidobacteriota bacterium]
MNRLAGGLGGLAVVLACAATLQAQSASSPASAAAAAASPPADVLKFPAGERVILELEESLHTRYNRKGDSARFSTANDLLVGGRVAIPAGSTVRATLIKVKKPGRGGGRAQIVLQFEEITLPDGTALPCQATLLRAGFADLDKKGTGVKGESGASKRDIATVALGAGEGALFGAVLGGGRGAAYGGAIGAGIGLAGLLLRRGPHLDLPEGMLFEVKLDHELAVPVSSVQTAQLSRPAPPASGGLSFPLDTSVPEEEKVEPPPEFPEDDTSTLGTTRVPPPPPLPGPPPPEADPTLGDSDYKMRVDVQLVLVEAFVRDDHGRPLDNLTREDFLLFEDGVAQEVRHFSRDELPLAVALVVDRSGSVAPYMPELRQAAYQTLQRLKPGDQVALFAFASEVERLEELTTDRRRIAERIARIRAGGGTNIVDAVFDAAYYLSIAAPDRRRALILISDNQATVRGQASQSQAIRLALEAGVVVYSIKTPGEQLPIMLRLPTWASGAGSVRKITEETGGEILDVDRVGSLGAALGEVISRLKTRYTLGYHSSNRARDGSFRKIDVRLTDRFGRPDRDYAVHARRGYYAPQETVAQTKP